MGFDLPQFNPGDRVIVTNKLMAWPVVKGNVGEVIRICEGSQANYWVRFDEGQVGVDISGNAMFEDETGENNCSRIWMIHCLDIELFNGVRNYIDPYRPGEKGWVMDKVAEGVDVMAVTEELVAQEVGK